MSQPPPTYSGASASDESAPDVEAPPADESKRVEQAAQTTDRGSRFTGLWRNLALIVALAILFVIGWSSASDTFMTSDNIIEILRLASVIGVVSIGMTFVITGGGIDLSVGAIVALCTVWSTTVATQDMATSTHWSMVAMVCILVGIGCGLVNGLFIAYGNVAPFMMTLAMLAAARGYAELLSDRQTQTLTVPGYSDFFRSRVFGVPKLVIVFALVAIAGWVLLNRTTFGRRTVAVGGNPEAAKLAGINVKAHTVMLYALLGLCCGIAAAMLLGRVGAGTSTNGNQYELDAIAAVVIGGTLLSGGRGTITGTVLGVMIFTLLQTIFIQNNLTNASQAIAKGAIIVVAVLLQQQLARSSRHSSA
jgi:ribose transport system permease protein